MSLRRVLLIAVALAIFGAAAWVLQRTLMAISLNDLLAALCATPPARLLACAAATAMSFCALGWYERFAARVVAPGRVPGSEAVLIGAISHAISNTLGFHLLTGTALRYRLFGRYGLGVADIARLTAIVGTCVALGSIGTLALALLLEPDAFIWGRAAACVGAIAIVLLVVFFPALSTRLRRRSMNLPALPRRALAAPLLVGLLEAGSAIAAFYLLLPAPQAPSFALVAAVLMGAVLLGVVSHAPGGVGVFEATVLTAFPLIAHAQVLAALLLYRLIYNLLPFALAVIVLGVHEARAKAAMHQRVQPLSDSQLDRG